MIDVENLYFTYPENKQPTLQDISFAMKPGSIFGFLGPSGAGKSTTVSILIGLFKKYTGRVRVLGNEMSRSGTDIYEKIGVAFEVPNLYTNFTTGENLRFYRKLYKKRGRDANELLEKTGLLHDEHTPVRSFSKGMKIRLNLCKALIHDPQLLFLDEPTAGLDPANTRNIMKLIKSEREKGKTIVLTTHNMHVADELCDTVAFIVDGRIALIDAPRALKLKFGEKTVRIQHRQHGEMCETDFAMQGLSQNKGFLELLASNTIETIHTREASLEDIFIKTTGSTLS